MTGYHGTDTSGPPSHITSNAPSHLKSSQFQICSGAHSCRLSLHDTFHEAILRGLDWAACWPFRRAEMCAHAGPAAAVGAGKGHTLGLYEPLPAAAYLPEELRNRHIQFSMHGQLKVTGVL